MDGVLINPFFEPLKSLLYLPGEDKLVSISLHLKLNLLLTKNYFIWW